MAQRYSTNPFDDDSGERLSFIELTSLVLLAVATSALAVVFALGAICADHRIVAALAPLL